MIKGLAQPSGDEKLRKLSLFSLEKRRLWGDLTVNFQYLKGAYKQEGDQTFARSGSNRTKGNGFDLKEERFRLDVRKKLFTQRKVRHWKRLYREAECAPSLEEFKARLDEILGNPF